jgi:hypothetical protein
MRTRVGRIEFWKHRLSISVTYRPLLFFSSYFFRSHSSSFFLVAISCFVPLFFFILFPLSPFFCWKLETGSRVRACICRHCLTWWSFGFEKLFPLRHCHMCFSLSLMSRNESLVALLGVCHEILKEFLRMQFVAIIKMANLQSMFLKYLCLACGCTAANVGSFFQNTRNHTPADYKWIFAARETSNE